MSYSQAVQERLNSIEDKVRSLLKKLPEGQTKWMAELCLNAIQAGREGNYPVASAIVSSRGLRYIGTNKSFFPAFKSSNHAEMLTLNDCEDSAENFKNLHLISTLEPCLMCFARISMSKVSQVTFLTGDAAAGPITAKSQLPSDFSMSVSKIKFEKLTASAELSEIGENLYEIGEEIWRRALQIER